MPRSRSLLPTSLCASVALVAGGVALATPAHAEPEGPSFDQCAAPFPSADLAEGQTVTGLTTAGRIRGSATAPEQFSGSYIDTLESDDGDILVFDLSGSRITHEDGSIDAGVWSGISGSPVYAEDGRLVGAVAYTFGGWEASSIAGVTPAEDVYALRDGDDRAEGPDEVRLSSTQRKQLVAAGAPAKELGTGAKRIAPVSAINLPSKFKAGYDRIAKRAKAPSRDVAAGGATQGVEIPIVAGGNLAAADSYGSISAYGLGTATAVCGDKVVGWGHPFDFRNASRTIHGASTSLVQADGVGSYKLANLAAPMGALTHDGLAGIVGRLGRAVDSAVITSTARSDGDPAKTYRTTVPNPEALAELAATHAFRDAALAQDQLGGGESVVSYTVEGTSKEDGKPVTLNRTDRYSVTDYLGEYLAEGVAGDIYTLQDNEFANLDIDKVTIDDTLTSPYKALKIGSIDRYYPSRKAWGRLKPTGTITVQKGKPFKLRYNLVKADKYSKATPTSVTMEIRTSVFAYGTGRLVIQGADQGGWDDEEEYYEDSAPWDEDEYYFDDDEDPLTLPAKGPTSAQEVASLLQKQPRNDDILVSQDFFSTRYDVVNSDRRLRAPSVVSGYFRYRVNYVR
jgi:hypothetical protein